MKKKSTIGNQAMKKILYFLFIYLCGGFLFAGESPNFDSGSLSKAFPRDMFDLTSLRTEVTNEQIVVSLAPYWMSCPNTPSVTYFDFKYNSADDSWILISDGVNEKFNAPKNSYSYGKWFYDTISARNEKRIQAGEKPLALPENFVYSQDVAQNKQGELIAKQKELKESLANELMENTAAPAEQKSGVKLLLFAIGTLLVAGIGMLILRFRKRKK